MNLTYDDNGLQCLLTSFCERHITQEQMLVELSERNIHISLRTLQRKLQNFHLTNVVSMTPNQKIISYTLLRQHYILGNTKSAALCAINNVYDIPINMFNINNMSRELGINWRRDDIQQGLITPAQLVEILLEHIEGEDRNAGYRAMQQALAVDNGVRVNQETVRKLVKSMDPEGVALRTAGKLKRRVFYVPGPNHLWASDGHDKLKPFGIVIYGFIDCWSRKVLSLHVGVSNNDPRRIGLQFLKLVANLEGFPQRTSTDHGSETGDLATFQILMTHVFCGENIVDSHKNHLFTTSQHNQKIESLWSQLMRSKNTTLRDEINVAIFNGVYQPAVPVQKALFLHLWIPLVQRAMDSFLMRKNTYRSRKNVGSLLPTGVSPDNCFQSPEKYGRSQGLNRISKIVIERLIQQNYPDSVQLKMVSPPIFGWQVSTLIYRLGYHEGSINLQNVWTIFTQVLGLLDNIDYNLNQ